MDKCYVCHHPSTPGGPPSTWALSICKLQTVKLRQRRDWQQGEGDQSAEATMRSPMIFTFCICISFCFCFCICICICILKGEQSAKATMRSPMIFTFCICISFCFCFCICICICILKGEQSAKATMRSPMISIFSQTNLTSIRVVGIYNFKLFFIGFI